MTHVIVLSLTDKAAWKTKGLCVNYNNNIHTTGFHFPNWLTQFSAPYMTNETGHFHSNNKQPYFQTMNFSQIQCFFPTCTRILVRNSENKHTALRKVSRIRYFSSCRAVLVAERIFYIQVYTYMHTYAYM